MCLEQYCPTSCFSDMNDLAMPSSYFVNVLKMLTCSEKHPVSRANYGYTKKVAIDRWLTIKTLLTKQFSANPDI